MTLRIETTEYPPLEIRGRALRTTTYSLAAALAWSWSWWAVSIATGGTETVAGGLTWLIGGFGPAVAVVLSVRRAAPDYRAWFRHQMANRRIAWVFWLAAVAFAVGPKLVGLAIGALFGHTATGDSMGITALPVALLFGIIVILIEEPLWRGVALHGFGSATTRAGLVIGVVWSTWHIPLFGVKGTFQYDLGFGSVDFFVFCLGIVGLSVVMTRLVVSAGGSILLAMVTHLLINLNGEFLPDDTTIRVLEMVVIWSVAAAVLLRQRPSGRPRGATATRQPVGAAV